MRDDYWVAPVVLGFIALFVCGLITGGVWTKINAIESCEQYYKAMPLQDIEPLCKQIIGGKQ